VPVGVFRNIFAGVMPATAPFLRKGQMATKQESISTATERTNKFEKQVCTSIDVDKAVAFSLLSMQSERQIRERLYAFEHLRVLNEILDKLDEIKGIK